MMYRVFRYGSFIHDNRKSAERDFYCFMLFLCIYLADQITNRKNKGR